MSVWPEIKAAKDENRHEIKLSGAVISERITKDGLDDHIFSLQSLNLLNISDTCLENIPDAVCQLQNLQSLLLFANNIKTFNKNVYKLKKLKVLDMSRNNITSLPDGIDSLTQLTSINFNSNQLEGFPQINNLPTLLTLDLSNNALTSFPDICFAENNHLSELKLNGNKIGAIPGEVNLLPILKNLDLSNNEIKMIPKEISEITKLKDLELKGNPIADNRLRKLVDQCRTKQVVDYVRQHCSRASDAVLANVQAKGGKKIKKGQSKKAETNESDEMKDAMDALCNKMLVTHFKDDVPNIKIMESVKNVRGHIVACIVHGLSFDEETFKKFIQMQTKLHDTVCDKRNGATIATHDLSKLAPGDLVYTAHPPDKIVIHPLNRMKPYTGQQLYNQLQNEAEALRKEKKRNVYSGIHKFLYLLEGKKLYACLEDSKKSVISFPPITNSQLTKMSHESKSMLVEVTSTEGQGICRKVMDTFLLETLNLGVGGTIDSTEDNGDASKYHKLEIQQMKIVDLEGNVKVVYPSKVDLFYEGDNTVKILRN